ncbi:long-chain fatty acid--CoA ligase [Natrinema thermotolerans]|uniref:Long-chain fatty acid--CoA ligase n=1 Tax=Natrinema thermotolerans TaxID=121872 RepID=A0AAF0T6R0_9EURY|nr:long-chain fatty acid--CoA ligase [Natrinema thermotolerans]QCC57666.1 long-chain fatty acid--CoA ligase [Natrinema thermotolerans]WMT08749.1 long-chain fatty acid--CoA ligase [Natrinema thermotolerans]
MTNLVTNLAAAVEEHGDNTAIGYQGTETSYEEFWGQTGAFATALEERGLGAGDRVALYLPNVPPFLIGFHGTLRAGGVVVPMNPQYKSREIGHLLGDSEAKVVVALADLVPFVNEVQDETSVEHVVSIGGEAEGAVTLEEFLEPGDPDIVDRADDDVAVQPYTSGTTGQPKGVQLTHNNLASNANSAAKLIPDGIRADDKGLGVLPLFHIYGMTVTMNATLFNGGAFYPMPEWDAQDAVSLIEDEQLTIMHGVPAMYNDVINQPNAEEFDLSSVRLCGVGGSGIPVEVLRQFEELYEPKIYEGYGLTETSPITHFNSPIDGRRVGSIGKTVPGVDSKVVDDDFEEIPPVEEGPIDEEEADLREITGEIVVAGPNVMKGYYGLPEANEEAFTEEGGRTWFHTGDIGYHDEDDFFYVVDREKHMIVTGGYNVYPREVEELLFEHEDVADAAVAGIPDERRGETVKAFVVRTPDGDVTEEEIKQYCLTNLAEYKHPREVEFVDELPRTTTGKVQKFKLREQEGDD